jgi:hypothetical protein
MIRETEDVANGDHVLLLLFHGFSHRRTLMIFWLSYFFTNSAKAPPDERRDVLRDERKRTAHRSRERSPQHYRDNEAGSISCWFLYSPRKQNFNFINLIQA